jgi:hypothetical protein
LIQASAYIGAGAYYIDIAFMGFMFANDGGVGCCVVDNTGGSVGSASDKMVNGKWGFESTPANQLEVSHENSFTSWNSNHGQTSLSQTGPLTWMRMYDDGTTNMTWYLSNDGYNWIQIYQESRTAWLTPKYTGLTSSSYSGSPGSWFVVHYSLHK